MVDILSRPRVEGLSARRSRLLSALRFVPKTLGYDRDVAINTYEAAARIVPAVRSEHDSRIEIVVFAGRSLDAKRARYQMLVANLSALGV
jgi:hypothetical protein